MSNEYNHDFHGVVKTHRKLPHWYAENAIYWLTFRLADSDTRERIEMWREMFGEEAEGEAVRTHAARTYTAPAVYVPSAGSHALARADVRRVVRESLFFHDGKKMDLIAAVIMPTHVHCLIKPYPGHTLTELMRSVKSFSGRKANALLGKEGEFWNVETYDHIVRNNYELERCLRYVKENPEKAGLGVGDGDGECWLYGVEGMSWENVNGEWRRG